MYDVQNISTSQPDWINEIIDVTQLQSMYGGMFKDAQKSTW